MNICMVTSTALPMVGGLETVVHNLNTALVANGHKVYHLTPRNPQSLTDAKYNYKVIRFGFKGYGRLKLVNVSAVLTLAYIVRRYKIDVINIHNVSSPGSWALFYHSIFANVPIVGTPHGDDVQTYPDINWGVRLDPRADRIVQRNVKSFSKVVAISTSIKDELLKIGLDNDAIVSIPNGIWVDGYKKNIDIADIRKNNNIQQDSIVLISVGRNHPVKGFRFVLDAVSNLIRSGLKVVYIIAGRDMNSIRERAEALGISEKIITPGEVGAEGVRELLQLSDIFVSSSRIESFGLTTLEAMCSGLPCVVTNVSGSKDLVTQEYGIFYEAGDIERLTGAIKFLIENLSIRKAMGEKAREAALKYDWKIVAGKYADVYEEVQTKPGKA